MVTESQVLLFSYTLGSTYMVFGYKVFSVLWSNFWLKFMVQNVIYTLDFSEIWSSQLYGIVCLVPTWTMYPEPSVFRSYEQITQM